MNLIQKLEQEEIARLRELVKEAYRAAHNDALTPMPLDLSVTELIHSKQSGMPITWNRSDAKKAKNFAEADRIRKELSDAGIVLEDKPGGATVWRKK